MARIAGLDQCRFGDCAGAGVLDLFASAYRIRPGLVFKSAAAGFALLGFMRLGTALFPHAPFDQMLALPVIECVVFAVVAVLFFRAS